MALTLKQIDNFVVETRNYNHDLLVHVGKSLAEYTTYGVGGKAALFCEVQHAEDVSWLVQTCRRDHIDYFILGGGSNVLVNDSGFEGLIIKLGKNFKNLECDADAGIITCGCACTLAKVANTAKGAGLSGMEFSAGTPGTIGGAIKMNAGTATD